MKHAKSYFDAHKEVDVLYFTSDDLAFFDERNAKMHAANLDDDMVLTVSREEADAAFEDMQEDVWPETDYDPLDELDAE